MITLGTATLKRALKTCLTAADCKSSILVLSHVQIECDSQGVCLSVTDLEETRQERIKYREPDTSWPTWSALVHVKSLLALLPAKVKDIKRQPATSLGLDGGYENRPWTKCELDTAFEDYPPKLELKSGIDAIDATGEKSRQLTVAKRSTDEMLEIVESDPVTFPPKVDMWRGMLHVECGAETTLNTLDPIEFPVLPTPERLQANRDEKRAKLEAGTRPHGDLDSPAVCAPAVLGGEAFRDMLSAVIPAISHEESRFQLSGALLDLNGKAVAVATDGHRLNRTSAPSYIEPPPEPITAIVPKRALVGMRSDWAFGSIKRSEPMKKVLGGPRVTYASGPRKGQPKMKKVDRWPIVKISASEHHIFFETLRGVRWISRIVEGTFPDYERVIKEGGAPCKIRASGGDTLAAVSSVAAMTGDKARAVRLDVGGEYPVFEAVNPDKGNSRVTLNGKTKLTGQLLDTRKKAEESDQEATGQHFGINPDYLMDVCKLFPDTSELTFRLWDENSQFQVYSDADPMFTGVIMPIRL